MKRRPGRTCRKTREGFPLHYYGALESPRREALVRHLNACPDCAGQWEETRRVLKAVNSSAAFPRESSVDWERFARDTVTRARIAAAGARLPARVGGFLGDGFRALHGWPVLAAASLVVLAVVLGIEFRPRQDGGAGPAGGVTVDSTRFLQDAAARQGAARYLRDSRALLVDLIRSPALCRKGAGDIDVALEKAKSRQLLRKKNLALGSLGGMRDQRLLRLVAQLETLLLQVSTFNDCTGAAQLHELREAIERRQLLLRIDLVTREMESGGYRV